MIHISVGDWVEKKSGKPFQNGMTRCKVVSHTFMTTKGKGLPTCRLLGCFDEVETRRLKIVDAPSYSADHAQNMIGF